MEFNSRETRTDGSNFVVEEFGPASAGVEKLLHAHASVSDATTIVQPDQDPERSLYDRHNYLSGPLDPTMHSKLPYYLRLRGSILPVMILPIMFVAVWATAITIVCQYKSLAVDSVLLTVLGFVVGMSLSFRSATAYERYIEGRKFWQQLILHSRNLARIIWIHAHEREGEDGKDDLLAKLTAINLILAFTQSVKHRLRHEMHYDYVDLHPFINNLNTFSKNAQNITKINKQTFIRRATRKAKTWGEYLGVSFCRSNPTKSVRRTFQPGKYQGNLPFEIMTYISSYIEDISVRTKMLMLPCWLTQVSSSQLAMMDAFGGCERVLKTPLPLAYSIAISQITWLYVLFLPFQLYAKLGWFTVPGTVVAAYIILGLAAIGREIENPFGMDVNDLSLSRYCTMLELDLNMLVSRPPPKLAEWMMAGENRPLGHYSTGGWDSWKSRSVDDIRRALALKVDHQLDLLEVSRDSSERIGVAHGVV